MVEGDGHVAELAHDHLPVAHGGPRRDPVEAEDPDLGMVDERRDHQPAELARARDGERGAAEVLRRERPGARGLGQPGHVLGELVEGAGVAAANDGDDEALVGLDGDAEVVAVEVDDLVALEPGVELRHLLERLRHGAQRHRDQAREVEAGEIALLDVRDGGNLPVRPREVLGDHAPHAPERDPAPLFGSGGGCLWL